TIHVLPIGEHGYRAAFSPDGKRAVTSDASNVRLWDVESGKELHRFAVGAVGVAFSPDGKRILSGGRWDKLVHLWDAQTGAELKRLAGHASDAVTGVAFTPDGRRAVSGNHDRTVRVWDLETNKEL